MRGHGTAAEGFVLRHRSARDVAAGCGGCCITSPLAMMVNSRVCRVEHQREYPQHQCQHQDCRDIGIGPCQEVGKAAFIQATAVASWSRRTSSTSSGINSGTGTDASAPGPRSGLQRPAPADAAQSFGLLPATCRLQTWVDVCFTFFGHPVGLPKLPVLPVLYLDRLFDRGVSCTAGGSCFFPGLQRRGPLNASLRLVLSPFQVISPRAAWWWDGPCRVRRCFRMARRCVSANGEFCLVSPAMRLRHRN